MRTAATFGFASVLAMTLVGAAWIGAQASSEHLAAPRTAGSGLTIGDAIVAAERASGGTAKAAALDRQDRSGAFDVVVSKDGDDYRIVVDRRSGDVRGIDRNADTGSPVTTAALAP